MVVAVAAGALMLALGAASSRARVLDLSGGADQILTPGEEGGLVPGLGRPPDLLYHFTMSWTNRSTFQQVIEFTGHEE